MDDARCLVEKFIQPKNGKEFGLAIQRLHDEGQFSFVNINERVFYTAFFMTMSSLIDSGSVGKIYGVSNVRFQMLLDQQRGTSASTPKSTIGSDATNTLSPETSNRLYFSQL